MINILILKDNQKNIKFIEATGHSGYAEVGQDIVCSAVSTLMETLANGLTEIVKAQAKVVVDEEVPHLSVTLTETDMEKCKYSQVLMKSTLQSLKQVANEFTKYIKIKEMQKWLKPK